MIKILAIGNSFSQDATRYLKAIADSVGVEALVVNLYIGGCSLMQHVAHIACKDQGYVYERNGENTHRFISLQEAIVEEKWDIVTIQQVSGNSGMPNTYEPYMGTLVDFVRTNAPQAKVYFHMTWAYEQDSAHSGFAAYERSQQVMFEKIVETTTAFAEKYDLSLIPSGKVIQAVRQLPAFDYANGGLSLCRDGYHMTLDYGRYALGVVWAKVLLDADILTADYAPEGTDPALLAQIRQTVHEVCRAEQ